MPVNKAESCTARKSFPLTRTIKHHPPHTARERQYSTGEPECGARSRRTGTFSGRYERQRVLHIHASSATGNAPTHRYTSASPGQRNNALMCPKKKTSKQQNSREHTTPAGKAADITGWKLSQARGESCPTSFIGTFST